MKQFTKIILFISLFFMGCSPKKSSVSERITFAHFVSDESEQYSPDYAEFGRKKDEWISAVDNSIEELVYSDGTYGIEMAMRATTHIMPDIFLVPSGSIRTYVYNNLILDLTPYIKEEADYRNFTFEEKVFAFPVFSPNGGVILYDHDYYKTGFPNTWSDVEDHSIGFSGTSYSDINNFLFNPIAGEIVGNSWIEEQISKKGNHSFYDPEIINAIAVVQDILRDKVNEDYKQTSNDEVKKLFLNRRYHAILCSRRDAEAIQKEFLDAQIVGIPGTSGENYCFGYNYGIAIRSGIEEDKLETCLSFCRAMMNDELPEGIIPMTYSMDSAIWITLGSNMADDEKKPEEIAWATQDAYEKYWAYDGGSMGFLLGLS